MRALCAAGPDSALSEDLIQFAPFDGNQRPSGVVLVLPHFLALFVPPWVAMASRWPVVFVRNVI